MAHISYINMQNAEKHIAIWFIIVSFPIKHGEVILVTEWKIAMTSDEVKMLSTE